jgi:rubrerythrin
LLKLDEEFVDMVVSEDSGEEDFYAVEEKGGKEEIFDEMLKDVKKVEAEEFTKDQPSEEVAAEEQPQAETKKVRVGGFFGADVDIKASPSNSSKASPAPVKVVESTIASEPKKSITDLKPPRKRISIKLCEICGATVSTAKCPSCGAQVS